MGLLKNILSSFIVKNINSNKNNIQSLNSILDKYTQHKKDIIDTTLENDELDLDPTIVYTNNDDNNADENREYKNFCTDIVTNYILDENELYNLLYIIHTFYNDCIDYYIQQKNLKPDDIIFLFKGGNIFKIIANKFWSELPNKAMYKFIEEYKSYFKRSDLDFGIYINPDLSTTIINDITIISYKLQILISEILLTHKEICFKWFKYNNKYKQEILQNLLFDINNTQSLKEPTSIYYNNEFTNIQFIENAAVDTNKKFKNQSNNYFNFENDNIKNLENLDEISDIPFNNKIIKQKINYNNSNSFMYNTINKALRIKTTNDVIIKFYLTRIKITFNLHLKNKINGQNIIPIGGELIDVGIGKDEASAKFFKNKHNYIDTITLNQNTGFYLNSVKSFNLNIYSFEYLYEDLKFILIDTLYLPWEDIKYKKRLYRLFFLTFIDVFRNTKKIPIKNKNITLVYKYFSLILTYIKEIINNKNDKNIKNLSNLLKKTKQDKVLSYIICKKNKCLLNKLLKYIISIIEKVLFPRNLINTKIHNNLFINNAKNNKRELNDNELNHLIDLLNYVLFNLNSFKLVNEYIINYSKSTLEFNYNNIDSEQLI